MARKSQHDKHCLVVMQWGGSPDESRWFKSWYDQVLKPAIELTGYVPVLSARAADGCPITADLLAHLAADSMVVVDLGGATPAAGPAPAVLYALGIRQGMKLPYVMMSWSGQPLPFEAADEHVVLEGRALIDLATNRSRLREYIQAAAAGDFYRPVDFSAGPRASK